MKFSIKDFFNKCEQICSFLRIWLHLLKNSLMENFNFCAVCQPYKCLVVFKFCVRLFQNKMLLFFIDFLIYQIAKLIRKSLNIKGLYLKPCRSQVKSKTSCKEKVPEFWCMERKRCWYIYIYIYPYNIKINMVPYFGVMASLTSFSTVSYFFY